MGIPGIGGNPIACIAKMVAIGSLGSNDRPGGIGIFGNPWGNGGDPAFDIG